MKILMIGPDRSVHGGISGVVNNYYDAGLNKKIDLTYIGTMVDGSKVRKLMQAGIALIKYMCYLPESEIVHVNVASDASFWRKSVFISLAHLFHKKLVIHQHGGDFVNYYNSAGPKLQAYVRKIFGMADVFLVLAPFWKEFFKDIVSEAQIIVFPNAVRIPEQEQKKYGQKKLLFLGRLCKDKGICELFESVQVLKTKYPELKLYLGGIWEDKELEQKAVGLDGLVEWLGWVSGQQKQFWLQECDIYVLPSYYEGMPVSVLEAMAASCVPVVTPVGGIPMMITDKENGIFVKRADTISLTEALDIVLSDPALCERVGKAAHRRAKEEFSLEESIRKLLKIYEEVLK